MASPPLLLPTTAFLKLAFRTQAGRGPGLVGQPVAYIGRHGLWLPRTHGGRHFLAAPASAGPVYWHRATGHALGRRRRRTICAANDLTATRRAFHVVVVVIAVA
jgi:hypothetical protein